MDYPSYREAFSAGEQDGLYGRPRRSTALAYTKGYDAGYTFYLRHYREGFTDGLVFAETHEPEDITSMLDESEAA